VFQLDFIAEGDVGTFNVNGVFLDIHLDWHGELEKKLQSTILDIVLAQHKSSYSRRASEHWHKVFFVVSMVCHVGERPAGPALETLDSHMYRVAYLQQWRPEHSKVARARALTLHRGENLKNSMYYYVLLRILNIPLCIITTMYVLKHITTYFYVL
jgi:hypothetical protein